MKKTLKLITLSLFLSLPLHANAQWSLGGCLSHSVGDRVSSFNAGLRAMYSFNDYIRLDAEYSVLLFHATRQLSYFSYYYSSLPTNEININLDLYLKNNKAFYFIVGYNHDFSGQILSSYFVSYAELYDYLNIGLGGQIKLTPKLNLLLEAKVETPIASPNNNKAIGVFGATLVHTFNR
jgi:hypothetical protein